MTADTNCGQRLCRAPADALSFDSGPLADHRRHFARSGTTVYLQQLWKEKSRCNSCLSQSQMTHETVPQGGKTPQAQRKRSVQLQCQRPQNLGHCTGGWAESVTWSGGSIASSFLFFFLQTPNNGLHSVRGCSCEAAGTVVSQPVPLLSHCWNCGPLIILPLNKETITVVIVTNGKLEWAAKQLALFKGFATCLAKSDP